MRSRARIILPVAFALAAVQSHAGAATVSVDIGPTATLQLGAQAVVASVTVTCPARAPTDGIQENRLEVRQLRRGTLVVGVGGTGNVTCDGKPHAYQITAHVQEPTHRFGTGPAEANMFVLICSATGATCMQGDVTESLVIVAG
ncbi:MAG TPA: hypothetical protein VJ922_04640 [Actinomycetota bacterium]|nr:hypothetical protein [Actinomycetota bacterium]